MPPVHSRELGFLDLSPDLRFIIYGLLFSGSKIELKRRIDLGPPLRMLRSSARKKSEPLPCLRTSSSSSRFEILSTCRTIRFEATSIFFHLAVLTLSTFEVRPGYMRPVDFYLFCSPDLTSKFGKPLLSRLQHLEVQVAYIDAKIVTRLPLLRTLRIQSWGFDEGCVSSWVSFKYGGRTFEEQHTTEAMARLIPTVKRHFLTNINKMSRGGFGDIVKMPERKFTITVSTCVMLVCKIQFINNFHRGYFEIVSCRSRVRNVSS